MPTITIDITAQQADRLADAWEIQFGVRPTIPQVKIHLVRELKAIVYHGEKKAADDAFASASFDPT
jgi:hypothetical protein